MMLFKNIQKENLTNTKMYNNLVFLRHKLEIAFSFSLLQ